MLSDSRRIDNQGLWPPPMREAKGRFRVKGDGDNGADRRSLHALRKGSGDDPEHQVWGSSGSGLRRPLRVRRWSRCSR